MAREFVVAESLMKSRWSIQSRLNPNSRQSRDKQTLLTYMYTSSIRVCVCNGTRPRHGSPQLMEILPRHNPFRPFSTPIMDFYRGRFDAVTLGLYTLVTDSERPAGWPGLVGSNRLRIEREKRKAWLLCTPRKGYTMTRFRITWCYGTCGGDRLKMIKGERFERNSCWLV